MGVTHREEGMVCKVQKAAETNYILGWQQGQSPRAHRTPPKHGDLTVQEQAPPSMGAPLPEMAGGKPYRDAKSEALGAPLWETARPMEGLTGTQSRGY